MNLILKQTLILGTTFFVILWFQNCEDTRNNKVRTTYHDTYKLPILVTALLGLIINFKELFNDEIVIAPIIVESSIAPAQDTMFSDMNQQVYTEMPDF
jgi:hypothetical protein